MRGRQIACSGVGGGVGTAAAAGVRGAVISCVLLLGIVACHKSSSDGSGDKGGSAPEAHAASESAGSTRPADKPSQPPAVVLKPEQVQALGLATTPLAAAEHRDEVAGYGVILVHDPIAQAVAELRTAQAVARQSQSALARARSLAGSPGAVSADVEEAAVRQKDVDAASLALAEQRLATVIGASPPWPAAQREAMLEKAAAGRIKLIRATFPLGALGEEQPSALRATPLSARNGAERGWSLQPVWPAPADANLPGRSFFAVLERPGAAEGERLLVYAPTGDPHAGVDVPASAVVMSEGEYWCYLERPTGTFSRIAISADRPTPTGYFVSAGLHPGDRVVTNAAAQLLAQESNSGAEPD